MSANKYTFTRLASHGFTLLELLVVMVIIGLLAAYVGPRYFSQIGKSERSTAKAQIESFGKALDSYRLDTVRAALRAALHWPRQAARRDLLRGRARRSMRNA